MHPHARGRHRHGWLFVALGGLCALTLLTAMLFASNWPVAGTATYIFDGGEARTADLPIAVPSGGTRLVVAVPYAIGRAHPHLFSVWADDCLEELRVNGIPLPPEETQFCDYRHSKTIAMGRYLRPGDNIIELSVRDDGGEGGANIQPSVIDPFMLSFYACILLLSAGWVALLRRAWKRIGPWAWFVAGGALLETWYAMNVTLRSHGFDVDGHIEYVRYVLSHVRIPPAKEGWEFYQPPLFYVLAAGWTKLAGLFLPSFDQQLKIFALFLGIAAAACSVWIGAILFPLKKDRWSLALFCALCLCFPGFWLTASRFNNDALLFLLSLAAMGMLLVWWRHPTRWLPWIAVSVLLALGTLAKSNMLVIAVICGMVVLTAPLRWRRIGALLSISGGTMLLLTGWLLWLRYGTGETHGLVGNLGNLNSGLAIRSTVWHFVRFHPGAVLAHPFNDPWSDAQGRQFLWEYVFRSAFFAEWSFRDSLKPFAQLLLGLGLGGMILAVIGMVREARERLHERLPLFLLVGGLLAAMAAFRLYSPASSSQEFRYIAPIILPLAYFTVQGALGLPRTLRYPAIGLLVALALGGALLVPVMLLS